MSKWLDRLADLPENREQTKPVLTELTKETSVGFVSAELVDSDFERSPSDTVQNQEVPPPALTELTEPAPAPPGYDTESGLPMDWIEGYRKLVIMRRPRAIPETTWTWLQAAAGELLTRWGRQLVAHGWSAIEVFGVHFEAPMPRVDCAGLLAMLSAHHKIEAISAKSVSLRTDGGSVLRYYRPLASNAGIVPVWELTIGAPQRSAGGTE
jgi:hypothetical protein